MYYGRKLTLTLAHYFLILKLISGSNHPKDIGLLHACMDYFVSTVAAVVTGTSILTANIS